ncbi:sensor histidine kinase [Faecalibacterium prausnitzii]|jgi:signal transduction histidine kinase|uniref:histidine kinase n=1 Tax=Faecalibacterium prausnitzii TaxID=853 RepID=A0A2A7AMZ7_9FIRM|nr:HAMP domain-containing sensor histidine kinase [Faecalibacterium prausnitzii]PDX80584.1 two-component sensor histidine kinase [Faecalibacterium prausnitzii]
MRSGITRRWLCGSLLMTVLLVLLVEGMFLYSCTRSYYNSVQQTMYRRFSSISGQLKMYTGDTAQKASASRSVALRRMVEQFSDKDKYEFMLLDSYGSVIASSSGTDAEGILTSADFEQAQETGDGMGVAIYRTDSSEMVMAVCCLVPYAAEDVAAMRLVTSLTLVQNQLKNVFLISIVVVITILGFTVASGLYFVRSIVVPLGQVERTAASIARGELDVRLPVTGDARDEVDRLRGTINRMAEGLEETEKMKNEFISSVSHELRTPLTSIRGWVETLRTLDDPEDENYRKGLEIINNETARLYNMVEELLDFSRLQNGRLKMSCHPLDLVAELTDAVLFCEARIQREGLLLSYSEPEEMIPVYADPNRLRQVFINILDNAIKYSAPGGRITVKIWQGEYKAFIEIIDQGRGIPPEDLENVKTKFYKGSNSVRGSGIGLALVDSIMTALDGTLDLKSTLGRGTVVTLGLPIYKR